MRVFPGTGHLASNNKESVANTERAGRRRHSRCYLRFTSILSDYCRHKTVDDRHVGLVAQCAANIVPPSRIPDNQFPALDREIPLMHITVTLAFALVLIVP